MSKKIEVSQKEQEKIKIKKLSKTSLIKDKI
jgi:hypothetical protein